MKTAWRLFTTTLCVCFLCSASLAVEAPASQGLTLKRAVELALIHSPAAMQAGADEQRAFAAYRETRDQFIPQVLVGSGLGDTWGYPLSLEGIAPSIFNVTAQSALLNPALRGGLRAARMELRAAELADKDKQNQVVQETVLAYLELVKWEQEMDQLRAQHEQALKMQQVVSQRVDAGVDNALMATQAKLSAARANLHLAQAQGAIDTLRATLSRLTGVAEQAIQTVPDSVPGLPELSSSAEDPHTAAADNPAVLFAQQHAAAELFRAQAEHRNLWPSVDFAAQYAVLAKFNNWLQFFPNNVFQRNNATIGVVIRFPFLNLSQHAHAQAADADAVRARSEAESVKSQASQENVRLQHAVQQLQAAQEVSELEYELAKSNADAVDIRVNSGTATIDDQSNSHAELSEKYDALQDANFELLRARIALLRAGGDLRGWVNRGK